MHLPRRLHEPPVGAAPPVCRKCGTIVLEGVQTLTLSGQRHRLCPGCAELVLMMVGPAPPELESRLEPDLTPSHSSR